MRRTVNPVPSSQSHLIVKCESSALGVSRMARILQKERGLVVSNLIRGLQEVHHLLGVDNDINGPLSRVGIGQREKAGVERGDDVVLKIIRLWSGCGVCRRRIVPVFHGRCVVSWLGGKLVRTQGLRKSPL